jgi:hypothetical protein
VLALSAMERSNGEYPVANLALGSPKRRINRLNQRGDEDWPPKQGCDKVVAAGASKSVGSNGCAGRSGLVFYRFG